MAVATTVAVTAGVVPAGTSLNFGVVTGLTWNNVADSNPASAVTFAGGIAGAGPVSWAGNAGSFYINSADAAPSRYAGGTVATFQYMKAYVGTIGSVESGDSVGLSFMDTWASPSVTSITSLTTEPDMGDWDVTQLGDVINVVYTGATGPPYTVPWVAGVFFNPFPDAGNMGIGVLTNDTGGQVGMQALAMSNTAEPPNCLSGEVAVAVAADDAGGGHTFVPLRDLGPHAVVVAVDADGHRHAIPVHVVRSATTAATSQGRALPGGGAASWSHVMLAPAGTERLAPPALWRCNPCRVAGVYGAAKCPTCRPVDVAGFAAVRVCDADPAWLPHVVLQEAPWFHMVPVRFERDVAKAVVTRGGLLTELYRTPLSKVLATGAWVPAGPEAPPPQLG